MIIARSSAMRSLLRLADVAAPSGVPVMLRGETGTGKTLVARRIHDLSGRGGKPFIYRNCSTLLGEMALTDLFGHARGAFTGATKDKPGAFEAAHSGTLFLDELGELPPRAQALLLRAVEDGVVVRVGEERERHVDVRLIVATHRDIELMIEQGLFRRDLHYRLAVAELRIAPLRERPEDVVDLATLWGGELPRGVAELLKGYAWPGNVREMKNLIIRCKLFEECGAWSREGVERALAGVSHATVGEAPGEVLAILRAETARQGCVYTAQLERITGMGASTLRRRLLALITEGQVERLGRSTATRWRAIQEAS